ncbi:MAG: ribonuclease HII [Ignavibacteriaceae bacterium]|nr:ribonuclease HII [Ignavibacteriaceae bacterium]
MPVDKQFDENFRLGGFASIAGVDEAGRGPLAGPVVAAAVILRSDSPVYGLDDSKKLSASKRNELFSEIIKKAEAYSISVIGNTEIDKINILNASLTAMKKAVTALSVLPDIVLVDGNKKIKTEIRCECIVKGDGKSESIAAASILAKVVRDKIMTDLELLHPGYGWSSNKGYPTKFHREAILKLGITPHHRLSFLKKMEQYELFGKE